MKQNNLIYWITTGLLSAMMLMSGVMYFIKPEMKEAFHTMGFPDWFRVELGAAKILGVAALLLPMVPSRFKEWAYFGFGIVIVSATIAHINTGQSVLVPLVALALLVTSYIYFHKVESGLVA